MRKPRIGMIGLGEIAQKAYLPILTQEKNWTFVGAFSPNQDKRRKLCHQYRIQEYNSLQTLADVCDAAFVHSSTSSHFEVVSALLGKGIDVYVDKPLSESVAEAEQLVELSNKHRRKLMVGFNRRFAPMYVHVKEQAQNVASVRFEKHRVNSVGPTSYEFQMLDDYIHVVDTVRWLAKDELNVLHGTLSITSENHLMYAGHTYQSTDGTNFSTEMHRSAGTNLERLELLTGGAIFRVKNMNTLEIETNNTLSVSNAPSWDTTLKQRGFEDAVEHFVRCVQHDMQPCIDGLEGLKTQVLVQQFIDALRPKS